MTIFAESDDTRVWIEHLEALSPPQRTVTLPTGSELHETLRYLEIPEEDIPDVAELASLLQEEKSTWWYLERAVWSLNDFMGSVESPPRIAQLRDQNDSVYRHFYVLVFVATLPFVREYHRARGIPDEIVQTTLADLGRNVRVHRKREGIGGLGVAWWLTLHFRGLIYQLGRLQFERSRMGDQIAKSVSVTDSSAGPETPVLSIHIPDFSGPMTPEACDASIANAIQFYEQYFPQDRYDYAVCHSWLLDPHLKTILRTESNIIRFQDRFTLAGKEWDSTDGIMEFVFGRKADAIDAVDPKTSLERGVVQHIRNGGTWWGYGGWFELDSFRADPIKPGR
jgi:hypothetical protein